MVEMEQVMITPVEMKTLMGIVDLLEKENLLYLMESGRFVLVNCVFLRRQTPNDGLY